VIGIKHADFQKSTLRGSGRGHPQRESKHC